MDGGIEAPTHKIKILDVGGLVRRFDFSVLALTVGCCVSRSLRIGRFVLVAVD